MSSKKEPKQETKQEKQINSSQYDVKKDKIILDTSEEYKNNDKFYTKTLRNELFQCDICFTHRTPSHLELSDIIKGYKLEFSEKKKDIRK